MRKSPELRTRALQYLARREYSRAELRAKLTQFSGADRDFSLPQLENLDALLDDLVARGCLSDERAAAQLLHAKSKRFGVQHIVQELRHKGVEEALITDALPGLNESELDRAHGVWLKKFGAQPADAREKARQIRFMQSRGFGLDVILQVLRPDQAEN